MIVLEINTLKITFSLNCRELQLTIWPKQQNTHHTISTFTKCQTDEGGKVIWMLTENCAQSRFIAVNKLNRHIIAITNFSHFAALKKHK